MKQFRWNIVFQLALAVIDVNALLHAADATNQPDAESLISKKLWWFNRMRQQLTDFGTILKFSLF